MSRRGWILDTRRLLAAFGKAGPKATLAIKRFWLAPICAVSMRRSMCPPRPSKMPLRASVGATDVRWPTQEIVDEGRPKKRSIYDADILHGLAPFVETAGFELLQAFG